MMHGMGFGGGWMMFFLFTVIVMCVFIFIRLFNPERKPDSNESPLEILRRRYAEGSITKKEFEEKKSDLR